MPGSSRSAESGSRRSSRRRQSRRLGLRAGARGPRARPRLTAPSPVGVARRGRQLGRSSAAPRVPLVVVVCSSAARDDVAMGAEVDVSYAISGDARLAFTVRAGGPHVMVWIAPWMTNQDLDEW